MRKTKKTKSVVPDRESVSTKSRDALRIGAYQGPTEMGNVETNGSNALKLLAEAHRRGVDFACMPECYLTGFGTPDVLRAAAISVQGDWFRDWVKRCAFGDMVSIVGFIERRGRLFHN